MLSNNLGAWSDGVGHVYMEDILNTQLSVTDKCVLTYLRCCAGAQEGVMISIATAAEDLGVSIPCIGDCIGRLAAAQLIHLEKVEQTPGFLVRFRRRGEDEG